jgi:hypothetical protein
MSSSEDIVAAVQKAGITLTVDGDDLVARPSAAVTAEIRELLMANKDQLIRSLQASRRRERRSSRQKYVDAFLREEMDDCAYVRFCDMLRRWQRRGGNHLQLLDAIQRGPYIARREEFDGDLLWIYHEDGRETDHYDRLVAACMERRSTTKGEK